MIKPVVFLIFGILAIILLTFVSQEELFAYVVSQANNTRLSDSYITDEKKTIYDVSDSALLKTPPSLTNQQISNTDSAVLNETNSVTVESHIRITVDSDPQSSKISN